MTRRVGWMLVLFALAGLTAVSQTSTDQTPNLYQNFLDPPRDFSPMPFWFWNGNMQGPLIQQEIRDMTSQHVFGAFVHARDGLRTPYLSDDWWKAIGAGLKQAKTSGFEFNIVDEYDWPSGEVRNIWMAANHQSEVLARQPDFRMKSLAYDAKIVEGPKEIDLPAAKDLKAVVAARLVGENRIDDTSLKLLPSSAGQERIRSSVPEGRWVIVQFHLEPSMGFDGGFVDLMNPEATKLYFRLSYGEYQRHFPSFMGNTIRYSFADHEGDYGYRIAWTPALFTSFEQQHGYDLHKALPLLIYDGGDVTAKVRADYLATVTQLYETSFWDGITKSAAELGVHRTGHAWEETLQWSAALQGSLFAVERGLNPVGVDSLMDFGRQPLNFKVAQSVADFEGRRFMCESQGVQGTDSYLDMEGIRRGTNAIGAWGVDLFVPHAFDYDALRANYPPDWLHQPYWPYFHFYADYTRRISYMNAESRHVANVLVYYPITSIWEHTRPLFSGDANYERIGQPDEWRNDTILVNDYYTRLILQLTERQWDYNIADDQYLDSARVEGNELVIGPQRFRAIIVPPISMIGRKTLEKLQQFYRAGGTVFAIRRLPAASPEMGGNDPVIKAGVAVLFGRAAQTSREGYSERQNPQNGRSYYVDDAVDKLIDLLDSSTPKDVQISSGSAAHLYAEHRRKLDADYYWLVNDSDRTRANTVLFSQKGIPEKWNALTGEREQLFYVNRPSGTDVTLSFAPWDSYYVVFKPLTGAGQDVELISTNAEKVDSPSRDGDSIRVHVMAPATLPAISVSMRSGNKNYVASAAATGLQPLPLSGDWQFRPEPERIAVPYAKVKDAPQKDGENAGWQTGQFDDSGWPAFWLSEEQNTIRNWQIMGPFPNTDNDGFAATYPPEQEFKPDAKYQGLDGQSLNWKDYYGNEPRLTLAKSLIWMETEGGRFSDSDYIVQFDPELFTQSKRWIVSYAHTYLFSPRAQKAEIVVAADNWVRVWLNHKQVFEQLRQPFWYELNDNWADRFQVDLEAGWNEVLLKVGKGRGTASGFYGFTFRVADQSGRSLPGVTASLTPNGPQSQSAEGGRVRWYRVQVPPGCVAVIPPRLAKPYRMLINGHELSRSGDAAVKLSGFLTREKSTLVIIADRDDHLDSPIEFETGFTPFLLTPWTKAGLENYSGTAVYTKNFTIPSSYEGRRLVLDLGRVSSVSEVEVNDKHAGTLVWRPYQLDITKSVKPGENKLRLVVSDTEANARAVGASRHILSAIDLCGLEGPVQIIPYVDEMIALHPVN